ncbi:MAG: twin-arginine translocation signal domain-containing protein, partial [Pseudomonadota bacterium]
PMADGDSHETDTSATDSRTGEGVDRRRFLKGSGTVAGGLGEPSWFAEMAGPSRPLCQKQGKPFLAQQSIG